METPGMKAEKHIPHTHNYSDKYVWNSYTNHRSFCSCGEHVLQGHVVAGSSSLTKQFQTCILCKGKAKIGFVTGPSLIKFASSAENKIVKEKDGLYDPKTSYTHEGNLILNYQDSLAYKADLCRWERGRL